MSLLGSTWLWFAIGSGALAALWLALHLLRVRLERVAVPTLMFFRAAAIAQRPRVLGGMPRRWLAYLLALACSLCAWFAFGDPLLVAKAGRSRVVLVDASGSASADARTQGGMPLLETRLARAKEFAALGLGPNGAVLAYSGAVQPLWHAGEAPLLVDDRARGLVPSGSGSGLWQALAIARGALHAGDDIVLLGGPELGDAALGMRVVREGAALVAPASRPHRDVPAPSPTAVAFVGTIPRTAQLAIASNPDFRVVTERSVAEILVVRGDVAADRPCLRLDDGVGQAEREPALTNDSPVYLGLRDRRRTGAALAPRADSTVWVRDARSGAPLVAACSSPTIELRIVTWLVDGATGEAAHQDIPRLLLTGLSLLAPRGSLPEVATGEPFAVPALDTAVATVVALDHAGRAFASLPSSGRHELVLAEPGRYEVTSAGGVRSVVAVAVPVAASSAPEVALPTSSSPEAAHDGHLRLLVLVLALALLTVDFVLYSRGRLP